MGAIVLNVITAVVLGVFAMVLSGFFLGRLGDQFGNMTPFIGLSPFFLAGLFFSVIKKGQSWRLSLFIPIVPLITMGSAFRQAFFTLGPFAFTGFIMLLAACVVYTMLGFSAGKLIRR
jgi:ABC-type polysaccharide/polyol phosphate export permease